jgi:dTDP-4-dehydrorhamnose 3,5-epimerase
MIEGVFIEKLKKIDDPRGNLRHMLRCDAPYFKSFGEVYFSEIKPGMIKAWRKHLKMTQLFAVPVGNIRLVIFDDRKLSPTVGEIMEIETGVDNYCLIRIPPCVWYGFKGVSSPLSLITNCADIPHDPNEIIRADPADAIVPYNWK